MSEITGAEFKQQLRDGSPKMGLLKKNLERTPTHPR